MWHRCSIAHLWEIFDGSSGLKAPCPGHGCLWHTAIACLTLSTSLMAKSSWEHGCTLRITSLFCKYHVLSSAQDLLQLHCCQGTL